MGGNCKSDSMLVAEVKLKNSMGKERLILYRSFLFSELAELIARAKLENSFGQIEVFPHVLELPVLSACHNISNTVLAAKANMKS